MAMPEVATCTCPRCGEVDVPLEDIALSVIGEDEGGYGFRCPECGDPVWKDDEGNGAVIKLLLCMGVVDIQRIAGAS